MSSTLTRDRADVKSKTVYVGVDLGLDHHVAVVLGKEPTRGRLDRFGFAPTQEGFTYFHSRMARLLEREQATDMLVGMEPTNGFWKPLAQELELRDQAYCLVNPYTVKKHREGDQLDRSRDDNRDAQQIAKLVRQGAYTQTQLLHGMYAELRQYVVWYDRLTKDSTRQKNVIWSLVKQVFPELTIAFKDLGRKTALAMLSRCAPAATVRQMDWEPFEAMVRSGFHGERLYLKGLRQAYDLAFHSVGIHDGLQAIQDSLSAYVETLWHLEKQRERAACKMHDTLHALPEAPYVLSIPGIKVVNAAMILGEIGDPRRYTSGRQLVKLAGVHPTPNTSGRKQRSRTPMSRKGRPRLRSALNQAVVTLIREDPAFKRRFEHLCQRKENPLEKMQAIGVLMNRLMRIIWALIQGSVYYDSRLA